MKKIIPILCFLLLYSITEAQTFNPDQIRSGSLKDINYLAEGYLSPAAKAMAVTLNNGWYSTAKPHKLGRVDVMLTPTIVLIPEYDQTFTIENSQMEELELVNGTMATSPTVFGEDKDGPALKLKSDALGISQFNAPKGIGFAYLPSTMAQLSVGLIKKTNISIRYIPKIGIIGLEEGRVGMLGFAIKHDIFQWIPGLKKAPIDGSVFFGYTDLTYVQPLDDGSGNDDQEMVISSNGYTARFLLSKKFLFITPYAGIGYNSGQTDVNINGTYEYTVVDSPVGGIGKGEFKDPVAFSTERGGGVVGNLGLRLKFLFVMALSVDYTFGAYESLTAGLGVSVDL